MEKLKKCRSTYRTSFTRTLGALTSELEKETPNEASAQATLAVLESKTKELDDINKQILDAMLEADKPEEDLDTEMLGADEYKQRFEDAKVKVKRFCARQNPAPFPGNGGLPTPRRDAAGDSNPRKFKLPKLEIKKFNGDPKEWLRFWSSFKKIHDDSEITLEDKFDFFIQSEVEDSRASEYVNSFPPTAENYPKVIQGLECRFGRKDLLVEVYMRELLKMVLEKSQSSLISIYDKLETQLRSLESLGVKTDTCAAMLFPLVESSLPEEILRAWQRKNDVGAEARVRLESLMRFLEAEVQNEERIQMAKSGFGTGTTREQPASAVDKTGKKPKANTKANSVATAAGLLATGEESKSNNTTVCIFCQEPHESANCVKAKEMSLDSRQAATKEKRACFACLKLNHTAQWCRSKLKCPWCGGKHVLLMCKKVSKQSANGAPADKKIENLTLTCSASSESDVCLQTLRVRLRRPLGESIVRALIDPGSHKSYVSESLAKTMQLEAVGQQTMVHLLFGGVKTTPRSHQEYKVVLSSLDGTYDCYTTMFNEEVICNTLPTVTLRLWQHQLKNVDVSLSDTGKDNEPISILIKADIAGRLYTGKIIQLEKGPTVLETKLGWTIMGKVSTPVKQ